MELTKEEYSKKILQDSEKLVKDSALNLQETLHRITTGESRTLRYMGRTDCLFSNLKIKK